MQARTRIDSTVEVLGVANLIGCLMAAVTVMGVVLFRLQSLATTKLEILFGTLLVSTFSVLIAIAGLLTYLMVMVRRQGRLQAELRDRGLPAGREE
jgi:hypothetical protein